MTQNPKRTRILTNRKFEAGFEAIELDHTGQHYWYAEEPGLRACFPVDIAFVKEKFLECGRIYDDTRG